MKLDPNGVERATDALFNFRAERPLWGREATEARARAALTAYFDHLKSEGLMREAAGTYGSPGNGDVLMASTHWNNRPVHPDYFPALILRTDKE